jgi:exopolyphosphatase/guanosine-5'-triphosphate,3'-diphosphate pyrophosphatase
MRIAIIDLGTNSIRFDIQEVSANRKGSIQHRRLYREKAMVRLGQNLFLEGKLNPESRRRTLEAISSFSETMEALKVDRTIAFGTAAMRDASDGEPFLEEIKQKTGVTFRIITGAEEASLIAKGIMSNEKLPKTLYALIDIGGGSTEVSICKGQKILHAYSFNLGVAKLQQVFLKTQPPIDYSQIKTGTRKKKTSKKRAQKIADPVLELRNFIKSVVLPKILIEHWPKTPQIIGSSGSIIALSKLVNKDKDAANKPFERKNLSKTVEVIKTKTPTALLSMPGMEPKRVDLILAGGILLDEMAGLLGAKTIRATEFALRDGILTDEISRYDLSAKKNATFSLEDIEKRAHQWGIDTAHYASVKDHCSWLFDHLKSIHGLKQEWKPYLLAAAILHDAGEMISHAHHAEHSEYMVKNANFVGMRPWQTQLIASLCRFHKEEKVLEKKNEKKIPFDKKDELRMIFLKLLAILQIADSIDRTHKKVLSLKKVRLGRSEVTLKFTSKYPCDLEILRFDQKKNLFEALFKKEIHLLKIK